MPSGHEALERIQQMDSFNPNLLEDITIGYQMKKDSQSIIGRFRTMLVLSI